MTSTYTANGSPVLPKERSVSTKTLADSAVIPATGSFLTLATAVALLGHNIPKKIG